MKAISIKQPWGSLICCGIKDVENRTWQLKSTPMRVLIHTGAKREPGCEENDMPDCWGLIIDNYQDMGIIGRLKDTPTSAIIGIATIDRCVEGSASVWANSGCYHWELRDVQLFKEPILGVKGKLGIFDVPGITFANLPECVTMPKIERNGTHLRIPVCSKLYDQIKNGEITTFEHNLTDANLSLFSDGQLAPLKTDKVTFFCSTEECPEINLDVKGYKIYHVLDDDGLIFSYQDGMGRLYQWWKVAIKI